jgi:glycosyltransferase involved in cell wall biosynthesis
MNILVVNWQDITNPRGGGAEVHCHEIFRRVAALGHRVTLACSTFPGAPARETLDGIQIVRSGARALFNFRFPALYASLTLEQQFDVVVEDLNKIPFFTPRFVRQPIVGIGHHLFGTSIFEETNPIAGAYVYLLERLALRYYRTRIPFMVVSPSTREEFLGHGFSPESLSIIQNCVDHARYVPDPSRRSGAPLIGYFGRLKKYKHVDHFLSAVAPVFGDHPGLKVVVMGDGDDRSRLERVAADLGIFGSVRFTGYLTEVEVVRELQRWWCCVMPSSKEGWGLTVVEANACGTPAIASDVPGLRDAVRDGQTGVLYPFGDIKTLELRMRSLLDDRGLRDRLAAGAVVWANTFSWDDAAQKTVEVLERVVAARRPPLPFSSKIPRKTRIGAPGPPPGSTD